jgi:hypothetical protein
MANIYTHSLKFAFIDSLGHLVTDVDNEILNLIYSKLNELQTHVLIFQNRAHYVSISWEKLHVSQLAFLFMGDLFTQSVYEFDDILYEHTHKTFDLIEKLISNTPYKINFYISRLPTTTKPITPKVYGLI